MGRGGLGNVVVVGQPVGVARDAQVADRERDPAIRSQSAPGAPGPVSS